LKIPAMARWAPPVSLFVLLAIVLVVGCAANNPVPEMAPQPPVMSALGFDRSAPPDTVADLPGFKHRIHKEGRIYIGGQPNPDALRELAERGVTAVVNLRTPKEMEDSTKVSFDEAALVDSLGLEYVWMPLGGKEHPYTPEAVENFAAVLERNTGPVLVHCTAAGRASHLWAAYLVRYQWFSVVEAYERGVVTGIGVAPMAQMLDKKLVMVETGF
jgi:uncharacterized protein (TIGR01244 family)